MKKQKISRRDALGVIAAAAPFMIVPRHVLGGPGHTPPSEKLSIACVGCGGKGASDIRSVASENIAALCDVDLRRAASTLKAFPRVPFYRDFRKMLEKEDKHIDAVMVSTPDHTHAVAAMAALKMGKHVYCQKPLAHDIFEVRALTEEARKRGLVTQMGIQIHAIHRMKLGVEMVRAGLIGKVHHVDVWSSSGRRTGAAKPDNLPRAPLPKMPVPSTLDWDLWLGPAPFRAYNKGYCPSRWRAWRDFGTGRLGDMGCHIIDPVFWALGLKSPTHVQAHPSAFTSQVYPKSNIVHWSFPARGDQPALTMTWYDGANKPKVPPGMDKGFRLPSQGGLYYGDKGIMLLPHMTLRTPKSIGPVLLPLSRMRDFKAPPQLFERGIDHYQDWIRACKGGKKPLTPFEYSGPLTETVLLGAVATLAGGKLQWDAENMRITNVPEANAYLRRGYRKGWML
ncbi:MAG: Gfo/Idh/MocA family oxidoreductase [Planctomycetes bacterium]|nr:Gfo/Idh/MocA family oxidoreductase [Planctomycetota bacterium]